LKPPALLGVTIPGRGLSAPSGGWPGQAGRLRGLQKGSHYPGPILWEAIPWEPVEGPVQG